MHYYRIEKCLVSGKACFLGDDKEILHEFHIDPIQAQDGLPFATAYIGLDGKVEGVVYMPVENFREFRESVDALRLTHFASFAEARQDALDLMPALAVQISMRAIARRVFGREKLPAGAWQRLAEIYRSDGKWEAIDAMQKAFWKAPVKIGEADKKEILGTPKVKMKM